MLGLVSARKDEGREGKKVNHVKAKHLFRVWTWNVVAHTPLPVFETQQKGLKQGCQTHFHRGPHQPRGCLQRVECN